MRPIDVQPKTYINFDFENYNKYSKFKIGDQVRISKYKHFCKRLHSKLVRRSFGFEKVQRTVPWIYIISDLKFFERFVKRNCKIQIIIC